MNFYQNQIWKVISKDIFHKDIFDVFLFGKKYWGVKKTHKRFGLTLNWFQVLGIEIPNNIEQKDFIKEIKLIKKQYGKFNNMFFQLGFINTIEQPYFENRKNIESKFFKNYNLYPSIKENMPCATVQVDLTISENDLYKNFSKSAKRNIKKSKKNDIYFTIANKEDISNFYNLWAETAKFKGFHIYPKKDYLNLIYFLKNTGVGDLYLAKKGNIVVSGSIEINENDYSYYLYGATNRSCIKLGAHYFLKYEMFKYLKRKGIKKVDLLGVSPDGVENHHLKGVSQFKHSLGGKHIEYFGNYDIPLNKIGYKIIRLLKL